MKKLFAAFLLALSASLLFACSSKPANEDIYDKLKEDGFTFEIGYDQSSEEPHFILDIVGDDYSFRYFADNYDDEEGIFGVYCESGNLIIESLDEPKNNLMYVNFEFWVRYDEATSESLDTDLSEKEKEMANIYRKKFNQIFEEIGADEESMYNFCKEYLSENYGDAIIE